MPREHTTRIVKVTVSCRLKLPNYGVKIDDTRSKPLDPHSACTTSMQFTASSDEAMNDYLHALKDAIEKIIDELAREGVD